MTAAADNQAGLAKAFMHRLGLSGSRVRPGFSGFWSWWLHALASWLPQRMRMLFGLARERLVLLYSDHSLQLRLERGDGGESRDMAQLPWPTADEGRDDPLANLLTRRTADLPRWLLLPASAGLRRRLTLPAAAIDRLRDVVAFEIDRQTPFAVTDVHYDARVVTLRGDQLDTELVVVPRATLDAAIQALGPLADTLAGVDMAGDDGHAIGINLLAGTQRHRRMDPWRRWNWAFIAIAFLAVAVGMWQMLTNRRDVADAFAGETAARAQQARAVAIDKRQLVDTVEGMQFLHATRAARPTTVEVLDELSRRLPDSTYLEKLSIEGDQLMLIGQSSEASALIGKLEASSLWRSPALTGALQPDPRTGRDRFTLTAQLAINGATDKDTGNASRQP